MKRTLAYIKKNKKICCQHEIDWENANFTENKIWKGLCAD